MSDLTISSRITPFLWFDSNAEDAVNFYLSVFKNSRKVGDFRGGPAPEGKPLTISFELEGIRFTALNGGPQYQFTPAISFVVSCESQDEVDYFWSHLTADGGKEVQCGWLVDKFGVSWQVVPKQLPELLKNPKSMAAMMKMKKLNIHELKRAAE
ncbi:MAG TPA: VOC family protein [Candidatus Koribacter sp.]|jgi:predicted 3-demethylubiquinone-9 3-methyltransferase (glyoxalase superfamily)